MEIIMIVLAGILFGFAVYNILQKQLLRIIIGTALLSHAAHLFILTMGKLKRGSSPVLTEGTESYSDPLPQALILTSIVISFGVTSLLLVLAYRAVKTNGTDNMEELRGNDHD
ncbi:Na(+)/H(+) antiporter subunit C [Terribacillus saccharophilus]|jgi:multicomponent Na+:H+ antiporter subunit C|uniref:Na(+)/H(+) antiporter subunit C n=1 Tax=Terribacillus saccharophilus TaxID=361277 RepID=A0A268HGC9_9BACI|nr:Na(+)/H(+) antiporter subunit C [Terribacillus saccharophilus]PAD36544.1 Na(+)/H(+) antiporter subunit C [Terribacillus saccharophilus]PAD97200.1 Na(+)/H(+) antiporter subunit C [Terribacillus saccharophilus]PAE00955.1 Na(+)/H(+) antiporter subunit C [Terribacillus saccharophilus]PAE08911.1 Na(+)/H(+) antiporter subunit C [Terribacillus saccharophilus]